MTQGYILFSVTHCLVFSPSDCHFALNDFSSAASAFQECINAIESNIDPDTKNERLASLYHRLGKSYAGAGDYDNAFVSYRYAIKQYNEALGSDNLPSANIMYDVGLLTLDDSENEKATQCFKEVIRVYTLRGEDKNTKVADAHVQLGTIQADNSEYGDSMESVKTAMRLYNTQLGYDTVETGKALLLCGRLNDAAGDYDEMVSNFSKALSIFKTSSGDSDINVSIALSNLGVAYSRKTLYAEAIEKCKEALRIRKLHTKNDRDVADSLFNIGNLYNEWGNHEEAAPYLEGAMKLYRHLLGDEDISIANCQVKLGSIHWKSGDMESSIDSFSDALYVCEEIDEDVEHLLIIIYEGLGDCYYQQGDLELALESYVSCFKIQKLEIGDDCIEIADTCDKIGLIYQESGKLGEAVQFYTKALEINEKHAGESSSRCFASRIKISTALILEQQYEDAIEHLDACIKLYSTEGQPTESEEIAMIYHQQGIALNKLGKHDDAIISFSLAIDMRTKLCGKKDVKVAEAMYDLGKVLEQQDIDEVRQYLLVPMERISF